MDIQHFPTLSYSILKQANNPWGYVNKSNDKAFDYVLEETDNDDIIYGSKKRDNITIGRGNDFVRAGAGNDKILLEEGNNKVFAEEGNDHIVTKRGSNYIDTGSGDDLVEAASDIQLAFALGDGNDIIKNRWPYIEHLVLNFPKDLLLSSFVFTVSADKKDLVIQYGNKNDSVTLSGLLDASATNIVFTHNISIKINDQLWDKAYFESYLSDKINLSSVEEVLSPIVIETTSLPTINEAHIGNQLEFIMEIMEFSKNNNDKESSHPMLLKNVLLNQSQLDSAFSFLVNESSIEQEGDITDLSCHELLNENELQWLSVA